MMLQLADNNTMTMLPGIDATTGEIVQINPEMFLALSRADQEEFMRDLPTALEALDRGMGGGGVKRIFNKYKDAVKNFVSEVREKDKVVRASDLENIIPLPPVGGSTQRLTPSLVMPADKMVSRPPAMDPNASLFVGLDPTFSPWFTKPPVLIAGGVLVLGTIYLLTRK